MASRRKKGPSAKQPAWRDNASFVDFYQHVFRLSAKWTMSDFRLRTYDTAVSYLVAYCGQPPALGDVTAELIDDMLQAQLKTCQSKWRSDVGNCLERIIRAWNPLACWRDPAPQTEPGSLREHFERSYVPEKLMNARAQTLSEYRIALRMLNEHVGKDVLLTELTNGLVAEFLKSLLDRGRSPVTANKYHRMLCAIWRDATDRGLAPHQPRIRKLREPKQQPDAFRPEELERIFAAATKFRPGDSYGPVPCSLWWPAALFVLYETAIRRRSLLMIRTDDVDPVEGVLYVRGEDMKDAEGQEYELSPLAVQAISRIMPPPRTYLFRSDDSVRAEAFANRITRDFRKIVASAGVRPSRSRLGLFHKIRRTTATRLAAVCGMSAVASLLGHSTEYVSTRYVDRSQLPRRGAADVLPPLQSGRRVG